MSQNKNKKNSNNSYGIDTENKKHYNRGIIIFPFLVFLIIFCVVYPKLIGKIIYQIHSPYFFASNNPTFDIIIVTKIFAYFCFFSVILYFVIDNKTAKKKYIRNTSIIVLIVWLITLVFNFNVWSFNGDSFSHNTILKKNIEVYTYDEIISVQLYYDVSARHADLIYVFKMNDGKEIKVDIADSFYDDEKMLFQFDSMISEKREPTGDYYYSFSGMSDEFNEYFQSLFF